MSGKPDPETKERPQGRCGSILFVEDDIDDFIVACHELRKLKITNPVYRVATTEAMTKYLTGESEYADREIFPLPAVIIIDLHLPGSNGMHAQAYIRSKLKFRKIPIIAISSIQQINALRSAVSLGADAFLVKPFERTEFARVILEKKLPLQFIGQ